MVMIYVKDLRDGDRDQDQDQDQEGPRPGMGSCCPFSIEPEKWPQWRSFFDFRALDLSSLSRVADPGYGFLLDRMSKKRTVEFNSDSDWGGGIGFDFPEMAVA